MASDLTKPQYRFNNMQDGRREVSEEISGIMNT